MYSFDCVAAAEGVLQPCCVALTRCQRPAGAQDDTSTDSVATAPAPSPSGVSTLLYMPTGRPCLYTASVFWVFTRANLH